MNKIMCALLSISYVFCANVSYAGAMGAENTPVDDWTGFYVGGNGGENWTTSSVNVTSVSKFNNFQILTFEELTYGPAAANAATGSFPLNSSGYTAGAQGGYNWTLNPIFIAGVETDIQALSGSNASTTTQVAPRIGYSPNTVTATLNVSQQTNYLGTVRGRLGARLPFINSFFAYGTAGVAYGELQSSTSITGQETPVLDATGFSSMGSQKIVQAGWTVGGGLEKFLTHRFSVKVEYLYYDLGAISYGNSTMSTQSTDEEAQGFNFINTSSSYVPFKGNLVRGGVNFKFAG